MLAARVHKPGAPDVIVAESTDVPEPGRQEVLIRVQAAGVGPWNALVRTGKPTNSLRILDPTNPHCAVAALCGGPT
jgi:NADPH:quinone reductase-like Zn-dependent oxidoreductase